MTLRFKTVIGVALIEAFLLALLIFTVMSYQHSSAEESLQKRAQITARFFASTTKDPLLSLDLASLQAFSEELLSNPDLVYVRVMDTTGAIYANAGENVFLDKTFIEDHALDDVIDNVYDTAAVIAEGGIEYGRVEIGFDIQNISTELADLRRHSIGIATVEMLLVALFSFLLGTYLTRQLKVLRVAARKVSKGDYTFRIRIKGKDEVAEVAGSFNHMSVALEESRVSRDNFEAELIELNHTLEDRVERRTDKINRQMEQLQKAKDTIADTQAKLVQSEKLASVGQLAAGVAHEINNPIGFVRSNLNSLQQYVELYQSLLKKYRQVGASGSDHSEEILREIAKIEKDEDIDFVNDDINELLKDCVDGTGRVRDIVQSLRDFSHSGGQGKQLCDLNSCIESSLKIAIKAMKHQCKITTELGQIPEIEASQGELNQVLMNLIINAGQAVGANGEVCVTTEVCGEWALLTVSDNGCGIKKEHLDKLFDPFFTTKPVGEGTGLGLAISYGIVQDHEGEIEVDSEPGVGTKFTVRLPIPANNVDKLAA